MIRSLYHTLIHIMPILAVVVFLALFFVKAGYGIFQSKKWGFSLPNKIGWILMESPAFLMMLLLLVLSPGKQNYTVVWIFFLLFELHYFQRSFVFPLLMKGKSRMPIAITFMGILFNVINAFLIGYDLFYLNCSAYPLSWLIHPAFIIGIIIFFVGMGINLHSDHVIRNLRPAGDTKHYLPQKGMYKYVTSGNYFGELVEWIGFAILAQSTAAWIFVIWTFANLAPRAYAIRKQYRKEFGVEAVGKRKCLIPYLY
ncbi:DUF1295 domain-containing protein [uncultured Bacteroides sp.]|uniref:DUF1295 domain-containing protein n=1 Tax=uncultured Bacteroides sp. TaxID=162156 RepID=UPI0026310822|nr:DUF1295 domain-containing protein [uncultured Bacteroides sp.]